MVVQMIRMGMNTGYGQYIVAEVVFDFKECVLHTICCMCLKIIPLYLVSWQGERALQQDMHSLEKMMQSRVMLGFFGSIRLVCDTSVLGLIAWCFLVDSGV